MYLNREEKPVNGYIRNEPVCLLRKIGLFLTCRKMRRRKFTSAYFLSGARNSRTGLLRPSHHPVLTASFSPLHGRAYDLAIEHAAVLIIMEDRHKTELKSAGKGISHDGAIWPLTHHSDASALSAFVYRPKADLFICASCLIHNRTVSKRATILPRVAIE